MRNHAVSLHCPHLYDPYIYNVHHCHKQLCTFCVKYLVVEKHDAEAKESVKSAYMTDFLFCSVYPTPLKPITIYFTLSTFIPFKVCRLSIIILYWTFKLIKILHVSLASVMVRCTGTLRAQQNNRLQFIRMEVERNALRKC